MQNILTNIFCVLFLFMLVSCTNKPHTEIVSASIEEGIWTGDIRQSIAGYRPVRIDFIVYDFKNIPPVGNDKDCSEITKWFVDYAHCYQYGKELERSYYYYHESEFRKGKSCKITVFYQIPDDGLFKDLSFRFDLDGFNALYEGEFANNVD